MVKIDRVRGEQRPAGGVSTKLGFVVTADSAGHIPGGTFEGLKEAGYGGVEISCANPNHLPPLIDQCRRANLQVLTVTTGRWLKRSIEEADSDKYLTRALEVLVVGGEMVTCVGSSLIIGLIRGTSAVTDDDAYRFIRDLLSRLTEKTPDLNILVEPIWREWACWPNTLSQGAGLIRELNHPHIRLLADTLYFVNSGEEQELEQFKDVITHLHIHIQNKIQDISPEYALMLVPYVRFWRRHSLTLSFELLDIPMAEVVRTARDAKSWLTKMFSSVST